MSCNDKIFVGDMFTLVLRVGECINGKFAPIAEIADATTKQIIYKKPDGTTASKDADFYTDGTDGRIKYTFTDGEIDQPSTSTAKWQAEGYVIIGGKKYSSTIKSFSVYDTLLTE